MVRVPKVARDDMTIIEVPNLCVGYVTGKNQVLLRRLEAEFHVLVFFADKTSAVVEGMGRLLIFGPLCVRSVAAVYERAHSRQQQARCYKRKTMRTHSVCRLVELYFCIFQLVRTYSCACAWYAMHASIDALTDCYTQTDLSSCDVNDNQQTGADIC